MPALPLVRPLPSPPDPLAAARSLAGLPYLLLLESAGPLHSASRYSFLCADPCYLVQLRQGNTHRTMPLRSEHLWLDQDPLDAVQTLLAPFQAEPVPGLPPFQGGAAGYIGYEWGSGRESVPRPAVGPAGFDDVLLGIYDVVIAWDRQSGEAWVISTGIPDLGDSRERRARERLNFFVSALAGVSSPRQHPEHSGEPDAAPRHPVENRPGVTSCFTRAGYEASIQRVVDYILAGDVFQVNLAQRFEMAAPDTAFDYYERLRSRSPAPFAALLAFDGHAITSASPERFLHLDPASRRVETRPIKGTRPRHPDPTRDAQLAGELAASDKDRAENVMIVDLLRNDLSRVCRPGSVRVPSLLAVESHPTVHHLVSTIEGILREDCGVPELLRATSPGGSITGAPKVRAMQIIAELEPVVRGPYTGAIGYWSLTGALDTSIVIRTALHTAGRILVHAGGGIVADSDPAQEYQETLDKAAALLDAVTGP